MPDATKSDAQQLVERLEGLTPVKRRLLQVRLGATVAEPAQAMTLQAFVATNPATDSDHLREFLRTRLPHYMVPTHIAVLDAIPHTPNGKVDRAALQRAAISPPRPDSAERDAVPDADEIEAGLRTIWRGLLDVDRIGRDDDFFARGGHSLLAVRMLAQVKATLGYDIPVAAILESPTIGKLAERIRSKAQTAIIAQPTADTHTVVVLNRHGTGHPLYFLPLHSHGVLHYRHLKERLGQDRPLVGFDGFDVLAANPVNRSVEALAAAYTRQLRAYQPDGPYYLCGISVAGLLAFEMARQLHAVGITDVAVLLFDTWGPGYPVRLPLATALGVFARRLVSAPGAPITPVQRSLDLALTFGKKRYEAWKATRARRTSAQGMPPNAAAFTGTAELLHNQAEVDAALAAMTAAYLAQHRPYAGSIRLYRADLQPWNAAYDETLGWKRFAEGGVTVKHVRGNHLGILGRAYSGTLAALVRQQLSDLDRQPSLFHTTPVRS